MLSSSLKSICVLRQCSISHIIADFEQNKINKKQILIVNHNILNLHVSVLFTVTFFSVNTFWRKK